MSPKKKGLEISKSTTRIPEAARGASSDSERGSYAARKKDGHRGVRKTGTDAKRARCHIENNRSGDDPKGATLGKILKSVNAKQSSEAWIVRAHTPGRQRGAGGDTKRSRLGKQIKRTRQRTRGRTSRKVESKDNSTRRGKSAPKKPKVQRIRIPYQTQEEGFIFKG